MEFNSILVPVTGGEVDQSAIELACSIAQKDITHIYVVNVIELKRSLSLDAEIETEIGKAEEVLNRARNLATTKNFQIETSLLQSRDVGTAIVDEAVERCADLILMAASYKQRFGTYSLGTVALYVLKNAPCPVMLIQEKTTLETPANVA
jgi:nucleotide-binding universal stress UspA family protein